MVVTIDSKFYSKLQLGISKYQEKTPADPLKFAYIYCNYSLHTDSGSHRHKCPGSAFLHLNTSVRHSL